MKTNVISAVGVARRVVGRRNNPRVTWNILSTYRKGIESVKPLKTQQILTRARPAAPRRRPPANSNRRRPIENHSCLKSRSCVTATRARSSRSSTRT